MCWTSIQCIMVDIMTRSAATGLERDLSSTTVFSTIKLSTCPWPNTWITSYSWCCTCCTECSWLIFCSDTICTSTGCSFTCSCTCLLLDLSSRFMDSSSSIFLVLGTCYPLSYSSTFSSDSWDITVWSRTIPICLPLRRITIYVSFYNSCCGWLCSPVITDMLRNWNSSIFF